MSNVFRTTYLEQKILWQVAAVHSEIEGELFDDVADANTAANVRGSGQGVFVVDSEEVQVQVQQQRSGILRVHLQLHHALHVSALNIKQLIIHNTLQKIEVNACAVL